MPAATFTVIFRRTRACGVRQCFFGIVRPTKTHCEFISAQCQLFSHSDTAFRSVVLISAASAAAFVFSATASVSCLVFWDWGSSHPMGTIVCLVVISLAIVVAFVAALVRQHNSAWDFDALDSDNLAGGWAAAESRRQQRYIASQSIRRRAGGTTRAVSHGLDAELQSLGTSTYERNQLGTVATRLSLY